MADNVIQRLWKLVLDKRSAEETEQGAKGVAENVEKTWKSVAAKIAGYLGAAFLLRKMVAFGKESVAAFNRQEVALNSLRGSVENAGASFDEMEASIRAAANAMQAATTVGDEEYFESLSRMITLTGDVSASMNNMGLAANVAAKFYKGEMAPAVELVSRVMNGQETILKRMGIEVDSAQEGLEVLAHRSFGEAEARARTFSGQMEQVNGLWGDFQEQVGEAITQGEGGVTLFNSLRAVIKTLSDAVTRNQKGIQQWVTNALHFAIDAADVLFRAITGMADVLRGGFGAGVGVAAKALAFLARGYALAFDAAGRFLNLIGVNTGLRETSEWIRDQADAINEWADAAILAGGERVQKGIDRLGLPVFTSRQFQGGAQAKAPLDVSAPMLASGALTEAEETVKKALETYRKAGDRIAAMQSILGDKFDATGAEITRTTALLVAMAENGVDPASEDFQALARTLQFLSAETEEVDRVLAEMNKRLGEDAQIAAMTGVESLDILVGQQRELEAAMRTLISNGIDPQDERMAALAARYAQVTGAIEQQTMAMQFQAGAADVLGQAIGASMEGGIGPAAAQKARQNKIEAAEMLVRAAAFALFGNPVHASGALKLAGSHAGLAAVWSGLARTSKGAIAAMAPPSFSGGSSAALSLGSARQTSSQMTATGQVMGADVSVYFVGPGFDAVNPEVQRVIRGAQQQAGERYGNVPVRRVRLPS